MYKSDVLSNYYPLQKHLCREYFKKIAKKRNKLLKTGYNEEDIQT